VRDPLLLVILNNPLVEEKSAGFVSLSYIVQKSVVPLATFVVLIVNVAELPSFTVVGLLELNVYVGGVVLVSLIVIEVLVARTVPLVLPERIEAVNVSTPSVVMSANAVTEKAPKFPVIVNEPELTAKSPGFESIVQ